MENTAGVLVRRQPSRPAILHRHGIVPDATSWNYTMTQTFYSIAYVVKHRLLSNPVQTRWRVAKAPDV